MLEASNQGIFSYTSKLKKNKKKREVEIKEEVGRGGEEET